MTEPGITLGCRVNRVVDGDTLDVTIRFNARVRLLDCWAPEANTIAGMESTEHLKQISLGKDGYLHIPITEGNGLQSLFSFGRILGELDIDGTNLAEMQVEAGHATKAKQ